MDRIGVLFTLAAYLLWGLFPLYFHALQDVSALEILAHRIVWSLVVTAAILMALRRGEWIRGLVKEPRTLAIFTGSALLIGLNWGTYVYSIVSGQTIEASLGYFINPGNKHMSSLLLGCGLPGGMMGSMMADLAGIHRSINSTLKSKGQPELTTDEMLVKLFDEVAYVWPRVGYPCLVTPFSQYVKNLAMMNVIQMEKGKERWGMIADDIWDMILGKAGQLPGKLAPEIVEKAEREGRKFFTGNPQDNYPDQLDKYRQMMWEKKWETGQDDEELFEYAMHPAQYEAYKSGKAKADFLEDVKKRREAKEEVHMANDQTKILTVDVNGQPYRVTVAFGDVNPATLHGAQAAAPAEQPAAVPAGEGKEVLSPLEGKFFLTKNAQETPLKVGDKVNQGDVICYVEAMKTYNAIRAEFSGTVTAICANSGDSVSEDDVLMKIL